MTGWVTFVISAYCACIICTGHTHGITKSGAKAKAGITVACEPKMLGRSVWIAGLGRRVCQDTGGRIGRKHIDLFVATHTEALRFGRHEMQVRVER